MGEKLSPENFAPALQNALDSVDNKEATLLNTFRACGLCPFNEDNINFKKYFKEEIAVLSMEKNSLKNEAFDLV